MRRLLPLLLIVLAACQPSTATPDVSSITPSATEAVESTSTDAPTATATLHPMQTQTATQLPISPTPLSFEYLNAPVPSGAIVRLGKGWIGANGAEISPDGQYLRIRSSIGIFLYRADTFEELWYLPNERAITFSKDSQSMLTYGRGKINVRDTKSSRILKTYDFDLSWRHSVFWSNDQRIIVMQQEYQQTDDGFNTSQHQGVTLWDVQTGIQFARTDGKPRYCSGCTAHDPYVLLDSATTTSLVEIATGAILWEQAALPENEDWSPDGQLVALSSSMHPDDTVTIINVESGATVHVLTETKTAYAWSPDSSRLIIGKVIADKSTAAIYDVARDKVVTTLNTVVECCGSIWFGMFAWSSDGSMVAGTYNHQCISMVWDSSSGEQIHSTVVPANLIYGPSVVFSPDDKAALVIAPTGVTRLDVLSGEAIRVIEGFSDRVTTSLTWSPDGYRLAMGTQSGMVHVFDTATRQIVSQMDVGCDARVLEWSVDGESIFGLISDCSQFLYHDFRWNLDLNELTFSDHPLVAHGDPFTFAPDRLSYATSTQEGISVIDAINNETLWIAKELTGLVSWSPDGRSIAVSESYPLELNVEGFYDWECRIVLLDAETGATKRIFDALDGCMSGYLIWSPDGRIIALEAGVGLGSFPWAVFDVETGRILYRIEQTGPVLAFSPDSSILAAPFGGTIILRDARTGVALSQLEGHYAYLWDIAWSPDGKYLASTSIEDEATVIIWDVSQYLH